MANVNAGSAYDATPPAEVSTQVGYIKTTTHNHISRSATIHGSRQVEIKGRTVLEAETAIHGDLALVRIGRYVYVESGTTLRPAPQPQLMIPIDSSTTYIPMIIGSHTIIGSNCMIQAAAIGSFCCIGNNVTIGERVIVKDCCVIADNVTLGPDTVIPPFTRLDVPRRPEFRWIAPACVELPPGTMTVLQNRSMDKYQDFSRSKQV
jgi:dynactin-5